MAEKKKAKMTPMMAQYQNMRAQLPRDVLLFFRLGDFYEMFFEDAKEAASLLGLTLTQRNGIPMCGVPHHAAKAYIAQLVNKNKRVAIAEQTSDPQAGKIVEREIAKVLSAGTLNEEENDDGHSPNFIACIVEEKGKYGLSYADHGTGGFWVAHYDSVEALRDGLAFIAPSELIFNGEKQPLEGFEERSRAHDAYAFLYERAHFLLCEHLGVQSLEGFGCADMPLAIRAAGSLLDYLVSELRQSVAHLCKLQVLDYGKVLLIDAASQKNLNLLDSPSGVKHSLLGVLDRTHTPMGGRKLREWMLGALREQDPIERRLDFVESLLENNYLCEHIAKDLSSFLDIEKTSSRLAQHAGSPRDLDSLRHCLSRLPELKMHVLSLREGLLRDEVLENLYDFESLRELLEKAVVPGPRTGAKEGGFIQEGYDADLDALRCAATQAKEWLAAFQKKERERTGIDSLKIKYNGVFGYFIEVSKAKLERVPEDYQRKQTLANAERYITPSLKEMEDKILGAEERARQIEYTIFCFLREEVSKQLPLLQSTAQSLAILDVLTSFALTAQLYNHVRPEFVDGAHLSIEEGRHPVLEQTLTEERFIANDTDIEGNHSRLILLTGPNMAGKSTYIRQVALIALMAQMGAFVPAKRVCMGLCDRIFCRVGASDNLTKAQSTFMLEMHETASILHNATEHSLVVLDEIGRGTATFDGLSIAWAVAEYLHDALSARCLFATHYHELTELALHKEAIANYTVAVREWKDDIVFLRRIIPGTADKSYGIQVARLAGLPAPVIERAKDILSHLETSSTRRSSRPRAKNTGDNYPRAQSAQLDFFALEDS